MKMFGDILRREEDVAQDIDRLNNICKEWKHYKEMLGVVLVQHNIKEIIPCTEHELHSSKQFSCEKCKHTGYIIKYKEESSSE